jgi:GDPmannose 4,6-dehydratase
MNKRILIIGGTGQFGFYLTKLLVKKKFYLYISTRNINSPKVKFYKKTFKKKIKFFELNLYKKEKIKNVLKKINPNFIFFFSGQSSVFKSFKEENDTFKSNFIACKNILDEIVRLGIKVKFFNATSSEIFGNIKKKITINSIKKPISPYGHAKLKSYNLIKEYRAKYKLKLYNGIIFNCESFLRPTNFVIPKICLAAIKAKEANRNKTFFKFGNINIKRDWGWCEEYVKKIWQLMQTRNYDFIIATGKTYSLKKLLNLAFSFFGLEWKDYILPEKKFFRKKEIHSIVANSTSLKKYMIPLPKIDAKKIILLMIKHYQMNSRNKIFKNSKFFYNKM